MRPAFLLAAVLAAAGLSACERHVVTEATPSGAVETETKAVSVDESAVKNASKEVASEVAAAGTAILAGVKEGVKEGRAEAKAELGDGEQPGAEPQGR
jgi:hypothetical protein